METKKYFFAVDLGATSGRTIVGNIADGKVSLEELTRFDNNLIQTCGHFYWDIYALYNEVIKGLKVAAQKELNICSIGIDTWGCDFVFIGQDGTPLANPIAYRDPHTMGMMEKYFKKKMSKEAVYQKTGIQFMNFNSLFQLYAMREAKNTAMLNSKKILFIPDALSYMLTGKMVCEYTVASTSQILNPRDKKLDMQLLASVGLSRTNFGKMVMPATQIGTLLPAVQEATGLGEIPVIAVAGHDTASAVAAVPASDEKFAYLSSGTWSLMGIETKKAIISDESYARNFTNEGGIFGTTRFLKNICGMWIYERCRKEWTDAPKSHSAIQAEVVNQPAFQTFINPDDPAFANPSSMLQAISDYCQQTGQPVPQGYAATCRCIFESLALRYRQVFEWMKSMTPFPIERLHIIGGGSLNAILNQFTANSVGVEVLAGPQEGTALGNIMLQAKASGDVADIWEMRQIIANSLELKKFVPEYRESWDEAYQRYLEKCPS